MSLEDAYGKLSKESAALRAEVSRLTAELEVARRVTFDPKVLEQMNAMEKELDGLRAQEPVGMAYLKPDGSLGTLCKGDMRMDAFSVFARPVPAAQAVPDDSRDAAYDMIDRLLRNSLNDDDYDEYLQALEALYAAPKEPKP